MGTTMTKSSFRRERSSRLRGEPRLRLADERIEPRDMLLRLGEQPVRDVDVVAVAGGEQGELDGVGRIRL